MAGVSKAQQSVLPEGDTDFRGVLATLWAKKWLILFLTVLAGVAAVAFVTVVTPKYTAEAQVILEYRDNYFTRPDRDQKGYEQPIDAEAVASQVKAIMSRDLARAVVRKLKLNELDEFDPLRNGPGMTTRILNLLGLGRDQLSVPPEERVIESFYDKILVYNLGKSRVISIEFSSKDPKLAAAGANAVADEYIAMMAEAKKSTTKGASTWLANAIEPMRLKVAEAEARVESYRAQNGLLVGASNATVATQQLGEMSTQMSNARTAQADLQAKARIIREALRNGRVFETSEVVNNELIRRLLEQRVAMKAQMALEERTLLSGHPRMKELTAQLNDLESQIRLAAERTARTFENDARVAGARVQSLQRELEQQKGTAAQANEAEVQLRALEREAKALRENYEQYLTKYRDAMSRDADAAAPADARVISPASAPRLPSFPKKLPIILLATLATLVLSSAVITARALFSTDGYEVPAELLRQEEAANDAAPAPRIAQVQGGRILNGAALAAARSGEPAVTQAETAPAELIDPATAEALRPVVQDLVGMRRTGEGLIVGIHAFGGDVLSEATAIPLARLLGTNASTILVDCAGSAEIDGMISTNDAVGFSDIVTGRGAFGEAIHRDRASRLHIIPFGITGFEPGEPDPLAHPFKSALEALVQTYDFIILSAGPLGEAMDGVLPSEDHVLMISSSDESNPHVARALDEIEEIKPGNVTVVIEEPALAAPRPANDRSIAAESVA